MPTRGAAKDVEQGGRAVAGEQEAHHDPVEREDDGSAGRFEIHRRCPSVK
jgi:hypothetical protein